METQQISGSLLGNSGWRMLLGMLLLSPVAGSSQTGQISKKGSAEPAARSWITSIHTMPGYIQAFQENKGQFKNTVNNWNIAYACNSGGTLIFFTDQGIIWETPEWIREEESKQEDREEDEKRGRLVYHHTEMRFDQANPHPVIEASDETPYYFCSTKAGDVRDPIDHIRGFRRLLFKEVYPGIDVEYTFHPEQGIKYALHLKPGADPASCSFVYTGQENLNLDNRGNLHIQTNAGDIIDHAPVSFTASGQHVESAFRLSGSGGVGFQTGTYGSGQGLIIDPWTVNPTAPPGSTDFNPVDVGMDAANNTYILGMDFNHKMYVQKYDPAGALKWSYSLNEYSGTDISDLAVDPAGNTYVASPYAYSNSNGMQYAMVGLNTSGARTYFYNTYNNTNVFETWVLAYSCNYSTLIQGGAQAVGQMQAAVMNPTNGTIGALNTTAAVGELISGTVAPNNLFYALAAKGSNGKNAVACFSYTGSTINYNWSVDPGYAFNDFTAKMNANAIPINGIAAGCAYLYTTDGLSLDQRSLTNGSLIRRITIPGGTNVGSNINSGLAVDLACGYVYVGSANKVICYDVNLNLVFTYTGLPGIVADVTLNNGFVSCCGAPAGGGSPGFVAQFTAQRCSAPITFTQTDATCSGGKGSATANPGFCSGPYTYLWSPGGQTSQTITNLTPGTYTVYVGTATSCATASATVTINLNTSLPATFSAVTHPSCNGNCDGKSSAVLTGGTAPITYSWSSGKGNSATATGLCAGIAYTCTVTDANGCTGTQAVNLNQPAILVVSPAQTNINCFGSANGTAHVTASGGTPAYTYSWNPVPATGQGTASVTGLIPGAYTCTLTDSGGCSITQLFTLTQPALLSDTHNSQNVKCKGGHDGTAGLILSGGTTPYTFSWSPLPPAGQGTPFISGLGSGSYTCFVTDVQGCSLQEIISITEPAALVLNLSSLLPVSCNGLRNGSATLNTRGGTPGYSYSWTPLPGGGQGTPVASGLIAGLYTCQVTDTNSCTALQTILITEPTAMHIVPAQTNITCNNLNNGSAVVHANGGTPAYTWQWSPVPGTGQGTDSAGGMSPGIYTCTVSDGNGCSAVQSFTLTEPAPLQLQVTGLHVALCNAGNNSSAKLSLNGGTPGYVYSWSPIPGAGQGTDSVSGLISGSYICTVKDTNGCINALTVLIAAPPVLNGLASYANPKCNGSSDGTASLVMSGGAPAYSYSWTPAPPFGQGTGHITGLTAGTYVCNVQDTNGCVFMQSVVLTQPPVLISGSSSVPESCLQHNGSITVTPSGGTGPYSFAWTPAGAPAATSTGLTAGVYTCTITDANGCFTTIRDTLVNTGQVPVAGIAASGPTTFCAGGQVLLTANGGGSYQWSNGDTTAVISVTAGGVYTVTVSNACGSSSAQVQILVNPLPSPAISGLKDVCRGDSVLLTASGGTTYSWNPGGQTTASIYVTNAGVYTVSVGNSCGTGTSVFQVNVHAINCVFTTLLDTGTAPLPVSFNDQSLGFPQSWTWNFGTGNTASGPNTVYTFTNGGTYTVTETIVDSFGCTSTFHVVILVTEPVSWIHIPNIFTPNGDGSNDNWFVASNFLAELDVKIYDRWGVAMAELKNPDEVWDGRTMAGMLASDGTYYYILFARGLDGKKYNNTGYLLLLRN